MNTFQRTCVLTRLREMWAAMDADGVPINSETRWSWCLLVQQMHAITGSTDNYFINAFTRELQLTGCILSQQDRCGKIIIHAKREKLYVG